MQSPRPWTLPLLFCVLAVWAAAAPRAGAGTTPIVVTTNADTGPGTLREAIILANRQAGTDTIAFRIQGPEPHTISPAFSLPAITDPVLIDGYTQPGSRPNTLAVGSNAVLQIELEGSSIDGVASGLSIFAGNSRVRGLVLNRWQDSAIAIRLTGGNVIEGNFIGTNVSGTGAGFPVNSGIGLLSPNNRIGGTLPGERNVISGNLMSGIGIQALSPGGAAGNVIQGNYIGTDKNGTAALGNTGAGIRIDAAPGTIIGGSAAAAGNLISGNGIGVLINGANADRTRIEGNYIGTDLTGTAALGNTAEGVSNQGAANTVIGGPTPTAGAPPGNIISGNGASGIGSAGGAGMLIQGNIIGTDETGSAALGNGGSGISLFMSGDNSVGGAGIDTGNLISDNNGPGVLIAGTAAAATGNQVRGNLIGTDLAGTAPLGNVGFGISIAGGASRNTIGGAGEGAGRGNTIAFNGAWGVQVTTGRFNAILGNSIHSNAGLGIDLEQSGVTPNDPGDQDAGGNDLQNFPVLLSVISSGGTTTVRGTLDTLNDQTCWLEFFSSPSPDPSGFGEGRTFLGTISLFISTRGPTPFTAELPGMLPGDTVVTATATDQRGNTSEFSRAVFVQTNPPIVTNPGDQTSNTGETVVLTITATDADDDTLTFSATGLPPGLSIHPDTGVISGTVSLNFAGVTRATVTASDGQSTGSASFDWRVVDNRAPTVSNCTVSPRALPVSGGTVRIALDAVDNIGVQRATAVIVLPNGQIATANLDPAGGTRFAGDILVPANSTVNDQVYGVRVSVRDAAGNSSATLDCGSFTVAPTGAPRLRLTPACRKVDFGRGRVGTVGRRRVVVRNAGTGTLRGIIGTLRSPFRVSRQDGVPPDNGGVFAYSLRAGESLSLVVRAAPTRPGVYSDRFRVTSSDPARRNAHVSIRAEGCRN